MDIVLRWYQEEAVAAIYDGLRTTTGSPLVVLPPGAGKSLIITRILSDVTNRWNGRALLMTHRKGLLTQTARHIATMSPDLDIGIYSASLNRRDTEHDIVLAGIQSIYERGCELGRRDLIIIDECQLIPRSGDGMYQRLLADLRIATPHCRLVGLTATPFRLGEGLIYGPGCIFDNVVFEADIRELIAQNYLCLLSNKRTVANIDTTDVGVRQGEFILAQLEAAATNELRVRAACAEIAAYTANRRSTLIFCSGREHGRMVQAVLSDMLPPDETIGYIDGEMTRQRRGIMVEMFRRGEIDYLVDVEVLTIGFDAPGTDAVVLLRPTMSPGLYSQMVGRGLRTHPGKTDCLILDFGGNIDRHGPVDQIRVKEKQPGQTGPAPTKTCPACQEIVHASVGACPACGHEFPPPELKHDIRASESNALSGDFEPPETCDVTDVEYRVHTKRAAEPDHPQTIGAVYSISMSNQVSEWICFEHTGRPRWNAEAWWAARCSLPCPRTAAEAVSIANRRALAPPLRVTYKLTETWPTLVSVDLGVIPAPSPKGEYPCCPIMDRTLITQFDEPFPQEAEADEDKNPV